MLEKQLETIGLTEKEAKVYLAALELGPSPVQNISQKAQVNRATTYVIIEGLMKKGVFSSFEQGKKRFFVAEGPESLKGVLRQQREEFEKREKYLDSMMAELKSLHNLHPQKPVVRFYEGLDGVDTVNDIIFDSKSKEILIFYPNDTIDNYYEDQKVKDIGKLRARKKIFTKEIYTDARGDKPMSDYLKDFTERKRISDKDYPIKSEILITDDKVMLATVEDFKAVLIENKDIADTMKTLFKLAYKQSSEENLEK